MLTTYDIQYHQHGAWHTFDTVEGKRHAIDVLHAVGLRTGLPMRMIPQSVDLAAAMAVHCPSTELPPIDPDPQPYCPPHRWPAGLDVTDLHSVLRYLQSVDPNGSWWYAGAPDDECGVPTLEEALEALAGMFE